MAIKKINILKWTINDANKTLNLDFDKKYWEFIIQKVNYKEITFNKKNSSINFPSFIPIKDLIKEILKEIEEGELDVSICLICSEYFDINKENGIFSDPRNLTGYICSPCSDNLSAKKYYENYLKI